MVQWLASLQEGPGFDSRSGGLYVSLHVLSVSAWVFSGFPPTVQKKPTGGRLIGHTKLPVGVNVSVEGCLSLYVSPAMNWMNWQLVQDLLSLRPQMLR